jgi:hypothetical protein
MKNSIKFSAILFFLVTLTQLNAGSYGTAGCGLGSIIFTKNEAGPQILAATTNGTSGNQTFGISFGTSNCTASGLVRKDSEQEIFVHLNYDALEREVVSGKGEKLSTLASMMGCSSSKEFGSVAKSNYGKLFAKSEPNPSQMLASLKQEIAQNPATSTTCKL